MKKLLSIHNLRKAGFNVSLAHIRQYHHFDPQTGKKSTALLNPHEKPFINNYSNYFLSSKGGLTIIKITKDGVEGVGVSRCSKQDSYVRKVGVIKALGKALQSYNTSAVTEGKSEFILNEAQCAEGMCSSSCSGT